MERSDVFVSYSRSDAAVVRRIVEGLEARGKEVWIDWDDIAPSVDWFDQIAAGIDGADGFVCVISPDWIESEVCRRELDHAAARGKRILPVLAREVRAELVPAAAARINWIALDRPERLEAGTALLVEQLEIDLQHVREHSRTGQAAQDWERHDRDPSYLLLGSELTVAEQWLAAAAGKDPAPTPLQGEFLISSRRAAARRQRRLLLGVSVALAVSTLLTVFALIQRSTAIDQRNTALARELGAQAERSYGRDPELSVLLAHAGVQAKANAESEDVLRTALVRSRVRARHDLGAAIVSVHISPDSKLYVVSTRDQRAYVYDLGSGRRLASFATVTFGSDVVWDPGSTRLAVGGKDGVARIYEARTGRALAHLETGHDVVPAVRWRPGGRDLAVAAGDIEGSGVGTRPSGGVVQVWDAAAGHKLATLGGHARGVAAIAWTGDGRTLLTGGYDPNVDIWTAGSWRLRGRLRHASDDYIAEIDAPQLASDVVVTSAIPGLTAKLDIAGISRRQPDRVGVRLWDLRSGKLIREFRRSIGRAAINPAGTEMAFGPAGNVIQIFDIARREPRLTLFGHDGPITALRYDESGSILVSSSGDGTVRVWNPVLSRLVATFAGHVGPSTAAEIDVSLRRVVSGGQDGTARVWSVEPESPAAVHVAPGAPSAGRSFMPALSPDGRVAVSRAGTEAVDVWDARSGTTVRNLSAKAGPALAARFSQLGDRLVTLHAGTDKMPLTSAVIWDTATWSEVARLRPAHGIASLSLSPSGRLATSGTDGSATVWTLDGERLVEVRSAHGPLNDAVLSDAGDLLLTAAPDKTAQLWSVPAGKWLRDLLGHGDPIDFFEQGPPDVAIRDHRLGVVSADFDATGRRVATGGADGTARVWDVDSGRLESVMRGHTEIVGSVEFSPDGSRLLTGSPDGTARIWRVDTGAQTRSVDHLLPENRIIDETRATWTSDGRYFVTDGVGSPTVSLWHADSGLRLVQTDGERAVARPGGHELVTSYGPQSEVFGCETCTAVPGLERLVAVRVTRALTSEERTRYLHASR